MTTRVTMPVDFLPAHCAFPANRPIVAIQGLGFVGAANAVATATSCHAGETAPAYNVIGIELDNQAGREKARRLNAGEFPLDSEDVTLINATRQAQQQGNFYACTDFSALGFADIIVVNLPLDIAPSPGQKAVDGPLDIDWNLFKTGIRQIGQHAQPDALILIESTIPPGTCEKIILPLLAEAYSDRNLPHSRPRLAHAYERVMPGPDYLSSIRKLQRVHSVANDADAADVAAFLSSISPDAPPPLRLAQLRDSETAKVLENTYRAVNIAFMAEWTRFADIAGIDLHPVLDAIRERPTHSNIRGPGPGVGGYCLTKDPLFAPAVASSFFGDEEDSFAFSRQAVDINRAMPELSLSLIDKALPRAGIETLEGRRVLLAGAAYRSGISDTRKSPSLDLLHGLEQRGALVTVHDPYAKSWPEAAIQPIQEWPDVTRFDVVVMAVNHQPYADLAWPEHQHPDNRPLIIDLTNALDENTVRQWKVDNGKIYRLGSGDIAR